MSESCFPFEDGEKIDANSIIKHNVIEFIPITDENLEGLYVFNIYTEKGQFLTSSLISKNLNIRPHIQWDRKKNPKLEIKSYYHHNIVDVMRWAEVYYHPPESLKELLKSFIDRLYNFNPDPDSVFSKEYVIREFFFHPHKVRLQDIISFTSEMVSVAYLCNSTSIKKILTENGKKFTTIFYRELQNNESFILNAGFSNFGSSYQSDKQDIHQVFPLQNDFYQLLSEKKDLYEFNPCNHGLIPSRPLKYLDHYPEYPFLVVPEKSKIYVILPEKISFKNGKPIDAVGKFAFLTVRLSEPNIDLATEERDNVIYIKPEDEHNIYFPSAKLLDQEIFLPLIPVIGKDNNHFQSGSIAAWQMELTNLAKNNFCTIPFDQSISINGIDDRQLILSLKN